MTREAEAGVTPSGLNPGFPGAPRKKEAARKGSSMGLLEGARPATLDFRPLASITVRDYTCSKPLTLWLYVTVATNIPKKQIYQV